MKVRSVHVSLQHGDSDKQHTQDIEKIFARATVRRWAWLSGTESGPGAGNTGDELIRVAKENGYRPWVPEVQGKDEARRSDCWIAVREDLIQGNWRHGYHQAFSGDDDLLDRPISKANGEHFNPTGLVHVAFNNDTLGRVNLGAGHYLSDARNPSSQYWKWNKKIAEVIGDWARKVANGSALAFYAGDQNMADDKNNEPQGDTFFGQPLTSAWDELNRHENTGHGNIDVIASYNKDGRVKAMDIVALDDKEFFLHTDHFLVEATFQVDPLPN